MNRFRFPLLLVAALAASPLLAGCAGNLPGPESEWTTTEGIGDQPPVSHIEGSIDLTPLEVVSDALPPPDAHLREHDHDREHEAGRAREEHPAPPAPVHPPATVSVPAAAR